MNESALDKSLFLGVKKAIPSQTRQTFHVRGWTFALQKSFSTNLATTSANQRELRVIHVVFWLSCIFGFTCIDKSWLTNETKSKNMKSPWCILSRHWFNGHYQLPIMHDPQPSFVCVFQRFSSASYEPNHYNSLFIRHQTDWEWTHPCLCALIHTHAVKRICTHMHKHGFTPV